MEDKRTFNHAAVPGLIHVNRESHYAEVDVAVLTDEDGTTVVLSFGDDFIALPYEGITGVLP